MEELKVTAIGSFKQWATEKRNKIHLAPQQTLICQGFSTAQFCKSLYFHNYICTYLHC